MSRKRRLTGRTNLIARGFTTRVAFDQAQEGLRTAEGLPRKRRRRSWARQKMPLGIPSCAPVRRESSQRAVLRSVRSCRRVSRYSASLKTVSATLYSRSTKQFSSPTSMEAQYR